MATAVKDQSRLIDHFKRVYSLIVGLALTEACKQIFPIDVGTFRFSSLWMFLSLFVTVIPIFQGGDRFLDVTYIERDLSPTRTRMAFMWDVYMLLITALILVGVARSIPTASPIVGSSQPHLIFFHMFSALFFFDVLVLFVGLAKADNPGDLWRNYVVWICSNALLGALCLLAALQYDNVILIAFSLSNLSFALFLCCIVRTLVDYSIDKDFMFPRIKTSPAVTAPSGAHGPGDA